MFSCSESCSGQLEATMLHSFLRAGHLRHWLERPDCPPAIAECKILFDKLSLSSIEEPENPRRETHATNIPSDLAVLLAGRKVSTQARLTYDGHVYARSATHLGNSRILYYPNGDITAAPVPGEIKYIFTHEGKRSFAVHCTLSAENVTLDPFRHYNFPIKLYSTKLFEGLEEVQVDWVVGHFASYPFSPNRVAVLSLSLVSHFQCLVSCYSWFL